MTSPLVVAHRGASADRAEHTLAAYELALAEGADGVECDVRLTRDKQLVCIHDRTIARTSNGAGLVSALTLEQLREFDFGMGGAPAQVLALSELIGLVRDHRRPVTIFAETKHPVRYGGLVEQQLLAELSRFGLTAPQHPPAVVVMSFAATAVWRVRRAAPDLPTVLLGESSRFLGGGAASKVGATAVGPSVKTLREHPDFVARAAAAGRETYCWTVDDAADVRLCAELGVRWIATNHPGRTRDVLAAAGF